MFSRRSSRRRLEARCSLILYPLHSAAQHMRLLGWRYLRGPPTSHSGYTAPAHLLEHQVLRAWLQSSVYFLSPVREFHPAPSHWRSWKPGGGEGEELVSKQFWPHTMKSFLATRRNSHQEKSAAIQSSLLQSRLNWLWRMVFFPVIICSSIAPSSWYLQSAVFVSIQFPYQVMS